MTQKFMIKTYGCQMNVYDSDIMERMLRAEGWEAAAETAHADVIILNSCHIREKAAQKIYSDVGRFRDAKTPKALIAVAGCVAQAEGEALQARQKDIGLVFGPQDFHRLPAMIEQAQHGKVPLATDFLTKEKFDNLKQLGFKNRQNRVSALLTIQEGCDKFCSFCVVPYTRGVEISRAPKDIIAEAKTMAAAGVKEIILLGQNVNAYNHQGCDLAELLAALAEIAGVARLRYTTSHPTDMSDKLIQAHGDNKKLMPLLHLPVQSGSDRILKKMNRRHSVSDYKDIISALRSVRPDIALSSDFIVGFPEESEEDFADTMALVKEITFSSAYSFKYSPRPGTGAADRIQVDESVKSARLAVLQKLLKEQEVAFHQSKEKSTMDVLVENYKGETHFAKTIYGQSTRFLVKEKKSLGTIVPLHITRATPYGLEGQDEQ